MKFLLIILIGSLLSITNNFNFESPEKLQNSPNLSNESVQDIKGHVKIKVGIPDEIFNPSIAGKKDQILSGVIGNSSSNEKKDPEEFNKREFSRYVEQFTLPEYPKEALEKNIAGNVYVMVLISEDGKVNDINFYNGSNKLFEETVSNSIKSWKFIKPTIGVGIFYTFIFSIK